MLTFAIRGAPPEVTADQFLTLIDVGVRVLKDAARDTGLGFTVAGLHASQPTIEWAPRPVIEGTNVEAGLEQIADRLREGIELLEVDLGMPDWMTETTAQALYNAASTFEDSSVKGLSFALHGHSMRMTRKTYRTLDRVLHQQSDAIGSISGVLITATLTNGPHVTVRDDLHGRGVRCEVDKDVLRRTGRWIGERVTVSGRLQRDHLDRPVRISNAKVDRVQPRRRVSVAEMGGAFAGGPDSVEWLREKRGG